MELNMNRIKTYNQFNEELTVNQRILINSPILIGGLLTKLIGQYPLLNFRWSEMKKRTTDKSFPTILGGTGNPSSIKSNLEKIKIEDIPNNKLKFGMFLRNWNVYLLDRLTPENRRVVYISKDELKRDDYIISNRLNDIDVYPDFKSSKKSGYIKPENIEQYPIIVMVAKFDKIKILDQISHNIKDIVLELEDDYGINIKPYISEYGNLIQVPIKFEKNSINWDESFDNEIIEISERIKDYLNSEGYKMNYKIKWNLKGPFYYYGSKDRFSEIIPVAKKWTYQYQSHGDSELVLYNNRYKSLNISILGEQHTQSEVLSIYSDDIRTLLSDSDNCRKWAFDKESWEKREPKTPNDIRSKERYLGEDSIIRDIKIESVSIIFRK
jgi:hypothetical protein